MLPPPLFLVAVLCFASILSGTLPPGPELSQDDFRELYWLACFRCLDAETTQPSLLRTPPLPPCGRSVDCIAIISGPPVLSLYVCPYAGAVPS